MALPLRDNAPTYDFPGVTVTLIALNALAFAIQWMYPGGFEQSLQVWGEVPARIMHGEPVPGTSIPAWVTMFTSMFMHAGWGHILGNMYALWLFGDNVEWVLGRARYVLFYLTCGLVASGAAILLGQTSTMPGIGASGAIAGVLVAYLMMYPRARITSLMWINPLSLMHAATGTYGLVLRNISAIWYVGAWVTWQVIGAGIMISQNVWMNLGIYAHVGGAIGGALIIYPLAIADRIPRPDSAVRSDALTSPIIGDEGDAGMGVEPVASLGEELGRIHGTYGVQAAPAETFHDYVAEELIERGDYAGALRQCREMLQIARDEDDIDRINGYLYLIDQVNDHVPGEEDEPPASELKKALDGTYSTRLRTKD